jgi:hypothetical protein
MKYEATPELYSVTVTVTVNPNPKSSPRNNAARRSADPPHPEPNRPHRRGYRCVLAADGQPSLPPTCPTLGRISGSHPDRRIGRALGI